MKEIKDASILNIQKIVSMCSGFRFFRFRNIKSITDCQFWKEIPDGVLVPHSSSKVYMVNVENVIVEQTFAMGMFERNVSDKRTCCGNLSVTH